MDFKRIIFFFLLIICLFSNNLWSQVHEQDYKFVKIREGMTEVVVSTIIEDHNGLIWMGTNGSGLYRYNGIDYNVYQHTLNDSTSISSSLIHCALLDKKNRLWVGTQEGLNLYVRDFDNFKRIPIKGVNHDSKTNFAIASLIEDNNGNLLVGTLEEGLYKLNLETFTSEQIHSYSDDEESNLLTVNSLLVDRDSVIYAGTNKGLKTIDEESGALRQFSFKKGEEKSTLDFAIQTLFLDSNNSIWIGAVNDGVYRVNLNNSNGDADIRSIPITKNRILSILQINEEHLFVATENSGLIELNLDGDLIKEHLHNSSNSKSILSNSIWSLYLDRNDRIWMGFYNKGVVVYDVLYDKFENIESLDNDLNSLKTGSVTGIVEDDDHKLWIALDGGGIDVYDLKSKKIEHINVQNTDLIGGLKTDYIESIFIDSKQNVWAGTWNGGLYYLEKGSKIFVNYTVENTNGGLASNTILSFDEDSFGTIWIGTFFKGLHSFDPNSKKFTYHSSEPFLQNDFLNCDIRKVLVDENDNIWVGTTQGLYKINKLGMDDYSVISFSDKMSNTTQNNTKTNIIFSLKESGNILWIGTSGDGLCKYDTVNDKFEWFNGSNGLSEVNICSIVEDNDGNLWLSGNSGLTKFSLASQEFKKYSKRDGLISNDFNINSACIDEKGTMYFGNFNGIDYFHPYDIKVNVSLPFIYLTDFKIFNKSVSPSLQDSPLSKDISETKSLTLSHAQSVFTIDYAGVNYTRPEKNQYAYYLEGLEETWNYVGNSRSATYTNLNNGDYVFKLKVANNDGVWNETPLTLKLTILPPWWKTGWAIFVYIALIILAVFLLNKITQDKLKEKQIIKNERTRRIQKEKLNEEKFQFFTNISHEFRTPLTLIINPIVDIFQDKSLNLPQEVRIKHQIIHKNAERLTRLINELMDFRKLEGDKISLKASKFDIVSYVKDLAIYFNEDASQKNIFLSVDSNVDELYVWADPSMLEKILFNLLSNAFKVTPDGGEITIGILLKKKLEEMPLTGNDEPIEVFQISISDTGPGMLKKHVEKIFDRFYQVDNVNKRYVGGTGIGLEVVKKFVEFHKGRIEVQSEIGNGSTFSIMLPSGHKHLDKNEILDDLKTPYIPPKTISVIGEEEQLAVTNTKTLLIVEDNAELRNYLKKELAKTYTILVAKDGKEGIEIALKKLPDLIITDVMMPEMDGFEFSVNIKKDVKTSHIPILMLTAKSMADDKIKGFNSGADAYLNKPFDMRVLKSQLVQLLTSRQIIFNKYFSEVSEKSISDQTSTLDKRLIEKILKYINENIGNSEINVELLASQFGFSRSQLYRKIKSLTGMTANEFLRNIRLVRAKQFLESGNYSVSDVCYKVGYTSPSYFTKSFKDQFGVLPTEVKPVDKV